jgi:hypothetical protein
MHLSTVFRFFKIASFVSDYFRFADKDGSQVTKSTFIGNVCIQERQRSLRTSTEYPRRSSAESPISPVGDGGLSKPTSTKGLRWRMQTSWTPKS